MRWDILFDDLEARFAAEQAAEAEALRQENERLRVARLGLRDRLRGAAATGPLHVTLSDDRARLLRPLAIGRDWFSAEDEDGAQCVVPLAAIAAVSFTAEQLRSSLEPAPQPSGRMIDRVTLAIMLRDLARRRVAVELRTVRDVVHGTIDRVGGDHLDLAVHKVALPRRQSNVVELRTVPLAVIVEVRVP